MINLGSLGIRSLLIGGLLAATSALANTATLYNTINDGIIDQRGGEFRAVTSNHGTFFTFCLERPVHVGMNTLYTYDVRPRAYGANRDLHDPTGLDGDPVSKGTAYLYELFSKGLLQSANGVGLYWDDHDRNAGLLQQAFWTLEDEFNYVGNPYVALVKSIFGDEGAYETYTGKNVQVMNLWGKNGQDIQSQLIYLPSIPSVPDAGATALLVALGV
ncbi:MAG: hypothetical protein ABW223_09905, partial [Rariglobus sp.]